MSNWLGLDISFFDMIFSFYRSADFVEMLAVIRLSFLAGRGETAGNSLHLQGPSHLGLPFQAAPSQLYARKFFL